MSVRERISTGVRAMLAANLVNVLANGLLILVLTRVLLDPEGYGRLNFALSVFGVVAIFATLGLPKSTARYVNEYLEQDASQIRFLIRRSLLYVGIVTAVVVAAILVLGEPVARYAGEPAIVPFLVVGAVYVAVRSVTKYLSAVFQGFNQVQWTAALNSISGVGRLLGVIVLVALGFGAVGALAGYVLGFVAAGVVGAVVLYTRNYRPASGTSDPDDSLSRRLLRYSVPLTATRGANVLDKKVDTVLVGLLLNMTAVGYYAVAKQLSDFVAVPAASFGFTISPAIGQEKAGDSLDRARTLYTRSLSYVILAYVPAAVGIVLVARPGIRFVFGEQYLPAVPVVQVFSGFVLVNAINKVTSDGLDFLGLARMRAIVKSLMAVSNFLLNLLLIPAIGVVGAAVATVVTYTVYTGTNVYLIHRELSIPPTAVLRPLALTCLIAAGMGGAVFLALPLVSGPFTLVGVVALGVGIWAVLALASGVVDPQDVASLLA